MKSDAEYWGVVILHYGIVTALFCLEYYELKEDYETCAVIIKAIESKNVMIAGLDLPTRLDADGIKDIRSVINATFGLNPDRMFERYRYYANSIIEDKP